VELPSPRSDRKASRAPSTDQRGALASPISAVTRRIAPESASRVKMADDGRASMAFITVPVNATIRCAGQVATSEAYVTLPNPGS
jgi:hypothetical protein